MRQGRGGEDQAEQGRQWGKQGEGQGEVTPIALDLATHCSFSGQSMIAQEQCVIPD